MSQKQAAHRRAAVNHQAVVTASARVLAYRRWGRDDQGHDVFRQLMLWTDASEDQLTFDDLRRPA